MFMPPYPICFQLHPYQKDANVFGPAEVTSASIRCMTLQGQCFSIDSLRGDGSWFTVLNLIKF